ncbi:uncharacterized protein METZ01_LOCUS291108, partial [marine metagenome]
VNSTESECTTQKVTTTPSTKRRKRRKLCLDLFNFVLPWLTLLYLFDHLKVFGVLRLSEKKST